MLWPHDGEMSPVQRCDVMGANTFGDSHHHGVDGSERKIGILLDQLSRPGIVGEPQVNKLEFARGHSREEQRL